MRTFKTFIQLDELETIKPKAKKEQEFVKSTYLAQVKDPGDLEKVGPEEEGPKDVKLGQGKRPADRLDNKQSFGEEAKAEMKTYRKMKKSMEEMSPAGKTTIKHINKPNPAEKKAAKDVKTYRDRIDLLRAAKARGALKNEDVDEALTDNQKKLDINKNGKLEKDDFAKLRGDKVKEAYATIKAKIKEDADAEILFKLYEDLNEDNQDMFMMKLEDDANALLNFAKEMKVD
jgi:hypothetical protein